MNLGKQIMEYRKKNNLSQEDLACCVGVTRQTISKWETGETSPDIKQATLIAKRFNISLDDLSGIDTGNVIVNKVSNIEKLAGGMIKFFKVFGITFYGIILISLISLTVYFLRGNGIDKTSPEQVEFKCIVDEKTQYFSVIGDSMDNDRYEYYLEVASGNGVSYNVDERIYLGNTPYEAFQSVKILKKVIISNGGSCS